MTQQKKIVYSIYTLFTVYPVAVGYIVDGLGDFGSLLLAVDFSANVTFTLIALWYARKVDGQSKEVNYLITFVINEAVECTVPIAYLLCVLMAYYGPNATHIGDIKFRGWNSTAIENIYDSVFWLLLLTAVDFGSLMIGAILVKVFAGLNVFKMFAQLQSDAGLLLAIDQAWRITFVSLNKLYLN